jgi:hypothetical protein
MIVLVVAIVGSLTLASYYVSSLSTLSQWLLAITPLTVALATFYFSFSIARDRRAREMATIVYAPLLKETSTWLNPQFQMFSVWGQLNSEQLYWIRRVPKEITSIFKQAEKLFQHQGDLRQSVNKLISEATDALSIEVLAKAAHYTNDQLANIQFYVLMDGGGGQNLVYPIWIIESGMNVPEFADDLAKKSYPRGTKWGLRTDASPRTGGGMKTAGGTEDTEKWLTKVVDSVGKQPDTLAFRHNIEAIRNLGERAVRLIGEELG